MIMIKKVVFSILVFVVTLELLLRVFGKYKTGSEKQGFAYERKYGIKTNTWFHTWAPNSVIDYQNSEFKYKNTYNELGNREYNIDSFSSNHKKINIVCLGDSFTEGDGAPYDSTWTKCFEKQLYAQKKGFSIYNAGVCGSDVFFDYKMLTLKLHLINPSVVISSVNYSDVYDVIFRGGDERFMANGTTVYENGPFWEVAYEYSHLFRAITIEVLGYNSHLHIKESNIAREEDRAITLIKKKIIETKRFCDSKKIGYYLIVHPHPIETNKQNSKLSLAFKGEPYAIDLFHDFYTHFKTHDIKQYSWAQNQHYNSRGYWLMGNIFAKHLLQLPPFNPNL